VGVAGAAVAGGGMGEGATVGGGSPVGVGVAGSWVGASVGARGVRLSVSTAVVGGMGVVGTAEAADWGVSVGIGVGSVQAARSASNRMMIRLDLQVFTLKSCTLFVCTSRAKYTRAGAPREVVPLLMRTPTGRLPVTPNQTHSEPHNMGGDEFLTSLRFEQRSKLAELPGQAMGSRDEFLISSR
jgi:hypothetical protein